MYRDFAPEVSGFRSLVQLGYNDSAVGPRWQTGLYENGYCDACLSPLGVRTAAPLVVTKLPRADIANFYQVMGRHLLVSDRLLSLFTKAEVSRLRPRPIVLSSKSSRHRQFFEVTGHPIGSHVAVVGGALWELASWRCPHCGFLALNGFHPRLPQKALYNSFVSEADLPSREGGAFFVAHSGSLGITMSEKRWASFRVSAAGISLWPTRVFVIPEHHALRDAEVRIEKQANGPLRRDT